ncbi:uncharacterized protein LOC120595463 [Pteropus medius]|uniref:uncharacterized protein LOC120595463 n=1 Tax=Pteropus vampyrus TaxID=132908 RepID=UPI00196AD4B7|nr:uncharacterized protein LOC120595463 [Pteropus giganteus]
MRSGARVLCGFYLHFLEICPETENEMPRGGELTCSANSQDHLSDSGAKPAWTFCPNFPVPVNAAIIEKRWTRRSSGNISCPSVHVSLLPGLRQASAKASSPPRRQAAESAERAKGPGSGPSSYPGSPDRRARGGGPTRPGGFCLLRTFHFYRSRTAAILPHRSCQQWGAAFTPPAHFSSSSFGHVPVPPRSRGCVEVDRGPEVDSEDLPHTPEPATWNLVTLDHGTKSLALTRVGD